MKTPNYINIIVKRQRKIESFFERVQILQRTDHYLHFSNICIVMTLYVTRNEPKRNKYYSYPKLTN